MTISEIIVLLPKSNWLSSLSGLQPILTGMTGKEKKLIVTEILDIITSPTPRIKTGKLIDLVLLGTFIDKEIFLGKAKQKGVLRHTHYIESKNPIPSIAETLLAHRELFKLSISEENYFRSLKNFEFLFNESIVKLRYIKSEIRRLNKLEDEALPANRKSVVKTLISFNDLNFLINNEKEINHDLGDLNHYTKEEISEAVSFILSQWEETVGLDGYDLHPVNYKWYQSDDFRNLILSAAQYLFFREMEIYMEEFGFKLLADGSRYIFYPPEEDFGKSHEMSMIIMAQQEATDNMKTREKFSDTVSYVKLSEEFHKRFNESFRRLTEPFVRYVSMTPYPLFETLKDKRLFQEDVVIVTSVEKEMLMPYDEFKGLMVGDHMTFHDFLTFSRVFYLMYFLISPKLRSALKDDEEAVLNSLCSVFTEEKMAEFLATVGEEEVVNDFLDCVTWEAGVHKFLDLQYQPILFIDGYFAVSIHVLANSRMTRNLFKVESKKGNLLMDKKNANYDKLIANFAKALEDAGFAVYPNVPIKFKTALKNESDIDILAVRDEIAFVIECKDSISAVGPFELRTSLERLIKGSDQLDYLLLALNDLGVKEALKKNRGIDITKIEKLCPVILMSSRQFWGYEFRSFPVRSVHEFASFIGGGEYSVRMPDQEEEVFNLWSGDTLTNQDVIKYLSRSGGPHNFFFDSMNEYDLVYKDILLVRRYFLVMNEVLDKMRLSLKIKTTNLS
ncbi:MAG TPA: hypothetical protein VK508_16145 [Cyclobacteriaceae bacterium]|nr:hypothetical protein [Cyclobacteriaceae bacterium]